MSLYRRKYNPVPNTSLVPTATIVTFKAGVANAAALPVSGNTLNDGRITSDTNNLYVWDGLVWVNQGDLYDLTWAALQDKPMSSVANIDNAVSLKHAAHSDDQDLSGKVDKVSGSSLVADTEISKIHTQNSDTKLAEGTANEVSATNVKSAVDLKHSNSLDHTQGTDQGLDTGGLNASTAAQVKSAVTASHAHSNKSTLDSIQEALTTALKNSYDACVNFITNFNLGTPAVDEVLAWNGSQFVPKTPQVTGFKGVDLFLDDSASGISTYNTLAKTPVTTTEVLDNIIVNANTVHAEDYISGELGGTAIDAGVWELDFYRYISSGTTSGTCNLIIEVYKRTSGATETLLFTVNGADINDTVNTLESMTTVQPSFVINSTDRLLIKVYGRRIEASNRTITFSHNGTSHYSHIHTPLILRHNDLAGLQGGISSQYNHLTNLELSDVQSITDISLNVMLNAFRIAQIGSLTIFNMVKGFMDEYEDESGVDLVNSINQLYNGTDDYYSNQSEIDSYTKSLLHCDGTNGSQIFTDEIGKTVTANGNAQLSTSIKKFGTASLYCPASGDSAVISAGGGSDFNLPYLTDFTIDWWEYRTSGATFATAVMGSNGGSFPGLILGYYEGFLKCCISGGSGWDVAENKTFGSLTLNVWKHYALTCESGTYRTFQDGVKQDEWVKSDRGIANMPGISLGGFYNLAPFIGYIDEFRFSKGIARWTSNFTPPSGYYAFSGNITLLSNVHSTTIVPTSSRIILFEEDVDSITLNTDIKAYVSRNNGTTFSQVTLEDEGNYITGARILSGLVDISGQPSGSNLKYKIESLNDKILKIHGTGVSWK